jgi:hypothetical protein
MTILKIQRKINWETGEQQEINEWLTENEIPQLPGVIKIQYKAFSNDLYGMVLVCTVYGEEERWFWFSDSEQTWKQMSYRPW